MHVRPYHSDVLTQQKAEGAKQKLRWTCHDGD